MGLHTVGSFENLISLNSMRGGCKKKQKKIVPAKTSKLDTNIRHEKQTAYATKGLLCPYKTLDSNICHFIPCQTRVRLFGKKVS